MSLRDYITLLEKHIQEIFPQGPDDEDEDGGWHDVDDYGSDEGGEESEPEPQGPRGAPSAWRGRRGR